MRNYSSLYVVEHVRSSAIVCDESQVAINDSYDYWGSTVATQPIEVACADTVDTAQSVMNAASIAEHRQAMLDVALNYADLQKADLIGANLDEATLIGANFSMQT